MFDGGRHILALAEQLAGAGVDQDGPAQLALHEEDACRQVADQGLKHVGGPAQVIGQVALLGDFGDHSLPADEGAVRVEMGGQGIADPAQAEGRRRRSAGGRRGLPRGVGGKRSDGWDRGWARRYSQVTGCFCRVNWTRAAWTTSRSSAWTRSSQRP